MLTEKPTDLPREPDQNVRLSELLDRHQAGLLVKDERLELKTFMQIYQENLLRKALPLARLSSVD
jgi:hypothetical protein